MIYRIVKRDLVAKFLARCSSYNAEARRLNPDKRRSKPSLKWKPLFPFRDFSFMAKNKYLYAILI